MIEYTYTYRLFSPKGKMKAIRPSTKFIVQSNFRIQARPANVKGQYLLLQLQYRNTFLYV